MDVINGTKELLDEFYDEPRKNTFKSIVIIDNGKPIGVVGLTVDECKMNTFTHISDELRSHKSFKRIVIKAYRKWLDIIPDRLPVYALADMKIEGAECLLFHAGFEHIEGDLWRRKN